MPTYSGYSETGDGGLHTQGMSTWANAKNASTATLVVNNENTAVSHKISASDFAIGRSFLPFDTSSIPNGAIILSGTIRLYWDNQALSDTDVHSIYVCQTTQSNTTTLTASDYNTVDFNSYGGSIVATSVVPGQNVINLNATGLGYVNPGGITKLAIVTNLDYSNTAPTGNNYVNKFETTENGDTAKKPLLTLEYITGGNKGYIIV